ncbi:hypothetical protein K438DRAFT_1763776 [Mycena galopus ATCC 62051]|nr:hypothetical protein K438DRAFT_1763776 [Mycena galopus ATCC 62051]
MTRIGTGNGTKMVALVPRRVMISEASTKDRYAVEHSAGKQNNTTNIDSELTLTVGGECQDQHFEDEEAWRCRSVAPAPAPAPHAAAATPLVPIVQTMHVPGPATPSPTNLPVPSTSNLKSLGQKVHWSIQAVRAKHFDGAVGSLRTLQTAGKVAGERMIWDHTGERATFTNIGAGLAKVVVE